jgi:hypothetical protein
MGGNDFIGRNKGCALWRAFISGGDGRGVSNFETIMAGIQSAAG